MKKKCDKHQTRKAFIKDGKTWLTTNYSICKLCGKAFLVQKTEQEVIIK